MYYEFLFFSALNPLRINDLTPVKEVKFMVHPVGGIGCFIGRYCLLL